MRKLSLPFLDHLHGLAPLVLRLGVGLVFAVHGFSKLTNGPVQFSSMLTGLGVGAPVVFAWLVTIAELIGGLLIIVGLLTRLATLPLIATLVGAILLVKVNVGIIAPGGLRCRAPRSTSPCSRVWSLCCSWARVDSRSTAWPVSRPPR